MFFVARRQNLPTDDVLVTFALACSRSWACLDVCTVLHETDASLSQRKKKQRIGKEGNEVKHKKEIKKEAK